jgi:hypothetical protein
MSAGFFVPVHMQRLIPSTPFPPKRGKAAECSDNAGSTPQGDGPTWATHTTRQVGTWAMSPASSGVMAGRWMSLCARANTAEGDRRMPQCTGELKDISNRLDSGGGWGVREAGCVVEGEGEGRDSDAHAGAAGSRAQPGSRAQLPLPPPPTSLRLKRVSAITNSLT